MSPSTPMSQYLPGKDYWDEKTQNLIAIPLLCQVVYQVANEGSRLDIPEGPLGSLIRGNS